MKNFWIRGVSLAAVLALGCSSVANDEERLTEISGSIKQVGATLFGIVPDSDSGTRYRPDALPAEFRVDDLPVIFSGVVGEVPANVRTWGIPLELTDIRRRAD